MVEDAAGADADCVEAPGLADTINCSPGCKPRLSRGSSGMIVNACGGYPALTGRVLMAVNHKGQWIEVNVDRVSNQPESKPTKRGFTHTVVEKVRFQ